MATELSNGFHLIGFWFLLPLHGDLSDLRDTILMGKYYLTSALTSFS